MKALSPALALLLAACQSTATPSALSASGPTDQAPDAAPFDQRLSEAEARAKVDAALATLAAGEKALIVFGANWCHDSRALAGWLADQRMAEILAKGLKVVYVDIGRPQTGEGRNLDIAERFGIRNLKSSPALVVASREARRLNALDDAIAWRNAAGRSEAAIRAALLGYAGLQDPAAR